MTDSHRAMMLSIARSLAGGQYGLDNITQKPIAVWDHMAHNEVNGDPWLESWNVHFGRTDVNGEKVLVVLSANHASGRVHITGGVQA